MTALAEPNAITEALVDDEWESLTSAGIEAAKHMDTGRWLLGDIASDVTAAYGEDKLGEYAKLINVRSQTLRGYERVARFFPRGEFSRPEYENLSWSHYRAAMRLKDGALDFLQHCAAETLTVEAADVEIIKRLPLPPRKLFEGTVPVVGYNGFGVTLAIPGWEGVHKQVRIMVYEDQQND